MSNIQAIKYLQRDSIYYSQHIVRSGVYHWYQFGQETLRKRLKKKKKECMHPRYQLTSVLPAGWAGPVSYSKFVFLHRWISHIWGSEWKESHPGHHTSPLSGKWNLEREYCIDGTSHPKDTYQYPPKPKILNHVLRVYSWPMKSSVWSTGYSWDQTVQSHITAWQLTEGKALGMLMPTLSMWVTPSSLSLGRS